MGKASIVSPANPANPAEALLQLAAEIRSLAGRGIGLAQALRSLGASLDEYRIAHALARATDRHKLRAMVEGWSVGTIRASVGLAPRSPAGRGAPRPPAVVGGWKAPPPWVPLVAMLAVSLILMI